MSDSSLKKVDAAYSPTGDMGQAYLASGSHVSMRLWEESPGDPMPESKRDYETVGYVIKGRATLHIEGQTVVLEPGHSWVVPKGSTHAYQILDPFVAVEATAPPAHVHARDEA